MITYNFVFYLMIQMTPESTLFPYTTLFRSRLRRRQLARGRALRRDAAARHDQRLRRAHGQRQPDDVHPRSEEHTSERQSRRYLVCRLLLEKKNLRLKSDYNNLIGYIFVSKL